MFYPNVCFLDLNLDDFGQSRVLRTCLRLSLSEQHARMNCPLALMLAASLGVAAAVELYEISREDKILNDDGCSSPLFLNPPLLFYGKCYSYCTVSNYNK